MCACIKILFKCLFMRYFLHELQKNQYGSSDADIHRHLQVLIWSLGWFSFSFFFLQLYTLYRLKGAYSWVFPALSMLHGREVLRLASIWARHTTHIQSCMNSRPVCPLRMVDNDHLLTPDSLSLLNWLGNTDLKRWATSGKATWARIRGHFGLAVVITVRVLIGVTLRTFLKQCISIGHYNHNYCNVNSMIPWFPKTRELSSDMSKKDPQNDDI